MSYNIIRPTAEGQPLTDEQQAHLRGELKRTLDDTG